MKLVRSFYERCTIRFGAAAYHSFEDVRTTLRSGGFLNRTLSALWPRPRAEQLVRRLLTSAEQLAAAATASSTRTSNASSGRAAAGAGARRTCHCWTKRARSSTGLNLSAAT